MSTNLNILFSKSAKSKNIFQTQNVSTPSIQNPIQLKSDNKPISSFFSLLNKVLKGAECIKRIFSSGLSEQPIPPQNQLKESTLSNSSNIQLEPTKIIPQQTQTIAKGDLDKDKKEELSQLPIVLTGSSLVKNEFLNNKIKIDCDLQSLPPSSISQNKSTNKMFQDTPSPLPMLNLPTQIDSKIRDEEYPKESSSKVDLNISLASLSHKSSDLKINRENKYPILKDAISKGSEIKLKDDKNNVSSPVRESLDIFSPSIPQSNVHQKIIQDKQPSILLTNYTTQMGLKIKDEKNITNNPFKDFLNISSLSAEKNSPIPNINQSKSLSAPFVENAPQSDLKGSVEKIVQNSSPSELREKPAPQVNLKIICEENTKNTFAQSNSNLSTQSIPQNNTHTMIPQERPNNIKMDYLNLPVELTTRGQKDVTDNLVKADLNLSASSLSKKISYPKIVEDNTPLTQTNKFVPQVDLKIKNIENNSVKTSSELSTLSFSQANSHPEIAIDKLPPSNVDRLIPQINLKVKDEKNGTNNAIKIALGLYSPSISQDDLNPKVVQNISNAIPMNISPSQIDSKISVAQASHLESSSVVQASRLQSSKDDKTVVYNSAIKFSNSPPTVFEASKEIVLPQSVKYDLDVKGLPLSISSQENSRIIPQNDGLNKLTNVLNFKEIRITSSPVKNFSDLSFNTGMPEKTDKFIKINERTPYPVKENGLGYERTKSSSSDSVNLKSIRGEGILEEPLRKSDIHPPTVQSESSNLKKDIKINVKPVSEELKVSNSTNIKEQPSEVFATDKKNKIREIKVRGSQNNVGVERRELRSIPQNDLKSGDENKTFVSQHNISKQGEPSVIKFEAQNNFQLNNVRLGKTKNEKLSENFERFIKFDKNTEVSPIIKRATSGSKVEVKNQEFGVIKKGDKVNPQPESSEANKITKIAQKDVKPKDVVPQRIYANEEILDNNGRFPIYEIKNQKVEIENKGNTPNLKSDLSLPNETPKISQQENLKSDKAITLKQDLFSQKKSFDGKFESSAKTQPISEKERVTTAKIIPAQNTIPADAGKTSSVAGKISPVAERIIDKQKAIILGEKTESDFRVAEDSSGIKLQLKNADQRSALQPSIKEPGEIIKGAKSTPTVDKTYLADIKFNRNNVSDVKLTQNITANLNKVSNHIIEEPKNISLKPKLNKEKLEGVIKEKIEGGELVKNSVTKNSNQNFTNQANSILIPNIREIFEQIISKIQENINLVHSVRKIEIYLEPKDLGKVDIGLSIDEKGQIKALFNVDSIKTCDLIRQNLIDLKQSLLNQGIIFDSLDVNLNPNSNSAQANHHSNQNLKNHFVFSESAADSFSNSSFKPNQTTPGNVGEFQSQFYTDGGIHIII